MYVPTLGPLGRDLTQVARYQVGADALRSGDRLADSGKTAQAASMYRLAVAAAEALANACESSSPRLAQGWRRTAQAVEVRARNHSVAL